MSNFFSNLLSSRKSSVRMLLAGVGAVIAMAAINMVEAKAQEAVSPLEAEMMTMVLSLGR